MTEYIDIKDITSEEMLKLWRAWPSKEHFLLDLSEVVQHPSTQFEIHRTAKVLNRAANIVSEYDAPVIVSGGEYFTEKVESFVVKNAETFSFADPNDPLVWVGVDQYKLSEDALLLGMMRLDSYRQQLLWWSVASMIAKKVFEYDDGTKRISIPYDTYIGDLDKYSGNGSDFLEGLANAAYQFMEESKSDIECIVVNRKTSSKILAYPAVQEYMKMIRFDRDISGKEYTLQGLKFIIDNGMFTNPDLKTSTVIPDDVLVFISKKDQLGGAPIHINRGKSKFNRFDSTGPSYTTYPITFSPYAIALSIYDNFIPTLARKNAVMHWSIK